MSVCRSNLCISVLLFLLFLFTWKWTKRRFINSPFVFLTPSHPLPLWRINQLSDTCTEADGEADRGDGDGKKDDGGREEAELDKGGMSQIGNISFQHVLSEHFICERRHGCVCVSVGGWSHSTWSKGLTQFSDETVANSSPTKTKCNSSSGFEMRCKTLFATPATHPEWAGQPLF